MLVLRTTTGVEIHCERGRKSAFDFKVRYRNPGGRLRTPRHSHWAVDLDMKYRANAALTRGLIDHLLDIMTRQVPANTFPPTVVVPDAATLTRFAELNAYGDYSAEFLIVVVSLIMLQEKTNYPAGTMNRRLLKMIRDGADLFSIISAATLGRHSP